MGDMHTYVVDVDRPWETRMKKVMGRMVLEPFSPLNDADYQARVDAVAAQVRTIVKEEGGKLNAVFNALGNMSVTTTEAGRARIEGTEYVLRVFENENRWRPRGPQPG